jgi:hypothetical protein
MTDPLTPDPNVTLTALVRQFTRVARLAAADPLRLMPLDSVAELEVLGAPIAALLDVAPFARLRDAIGGTAAARRGNAARGRLQPLSERDTAGRAKLASTGATSTSGEGTGQTAVPSATRRSPSARPTGSLSPASQIPERRESASITTLAERRAAVRRAAAEPSSRSRPTATESGRADAESGTSTAQPGAREISLRHLRQRHDEAAEHRHEEPAIPIAAHLLRERAHESSPLDEPATEAAEHETTLPPDRLARFEQTRVGGEAQSTRPRSTADAEPAAASGAASRRVAALTPDVIGITPRADASAEPRPRASQPAADADLADDLFEALYRDGVDLSWP